MLKVGYGNFTDLTKNRMSFNSQNIMRGRISRQIRRDLKFEKKSFNINLVAQHCRSSST